MRLAADGRICLYFRPPDYSKQKGIIKTIHDSNLLLIKMGGTSLAYWDSHPEVEEMTRLQREGMGGSGRTSDEEEEESTSEESDQECSDDDSDSILEQNKFSALMNLQDSSDD